METYLRKSTKVPFDSLYLDPNNPRLAPDDPPGYEDPEKLFDPKLQEYLEKRADEEFDIPALHQAIVGQGWMPIDAIVIWEHPDGSDRNVVLEGNRRTATLRRLREMLPNEEKKLERLSNRRGASKHDIATQERRVRQIKQVIADTEMLDVLPLDASTQEELEQKLPRVLAVRHVTGAKNWGSYAEDWWLLQRYEQLFDSEFPGKELRWEPSVIARVGDEASLKPVTTRRKLLAASCFSHFKVRFEEHLPPGEEFEPGDYYLFENIVKKPWLRVQFGLGEDDRFLAEDREQVLFDWVFKLPSHVSGEDNENVFYRHENVLVWEKIKRYDDKHGTGFAERLDVTDPASAPRFREVEADYLAHMARKKPGDVLEALLDHLGAVKEETIEQEGEFLAEQLERLDQRVQRLRRMVKAAA